MTDNKKLDDFLPQRDGTFYKEFNKLNASEKITNAQVIEKIKTVKDPEIPVNLYDLGLIYNINIDRNNNIVVEIETDLPPEDLASVLIFIEESLERERGKKNDPRTCDIDIIDFKNKIINFKYKDLEFKVPHAKIAYRNFVLFPLQEIYPDWKHPKTKELISVLIENLSKEDKNSILKVKKS